MTVLLSYPMTESTPAPGGHRALRIRLDETVGNGAYGNTYYYTVWNHAGTHVDSPAHMLPDGVSPAELPLAAFVFTHPTVADIPKGPGERISRHDIERCSTDLLLLRTGASDFRAAEPDRYREWGPGLSTDAARYIADGPFSRLRALGIDAISFAAAQHVDEGVAAHKILFAVNRGYPFLLIEDMLLRFPGRQLNEVTVVPFFVVGIDSCQCTVLGKLDD